MKITRRNFLKGSAALSATSLAPAVTGINIAHAQEGDFKALVCIFLFGGNDAYNMVIPDNDAEYSDYLNARPELAIVREEAVSIGIATDNGVPLALHPSMKSLQAVFTEDKKATVIVNSGQLVEPVIGSAVANPELPEFLMAHNLQQTMWQSGAENMKDKLGWAGRMVRDMHLPGSLSPLISLNGEKKWLRSENHEQLVLTTDGAGEYSGLKTPERYEAMLRHFNEKFSNLYADNYSETMADRYYDNEKAKEALGNVGELTGYPDTHLGHSLQTTAKVIRSRADLGHQRQIYFVGLGGFDTHKDQQAKHAGLLQHVSDAMAAFYLDMKSIQMADKVTAFTMSDFGRRIMANETGTDHGWAGHQIVVGGAVKGGKAYGKWPELVPGSQYDYKNGRIVPEIAADQVNASLARWFGYQGALTDLFPSLKSFKSHYLDFI